MPAVATKKAKADEPFNCRLMMRPTCKDVLIEEQSLTHLRCLPVYFHSYHETSSSHFLQLWHLAKRLKEIITYTGGIVHQVFPLHNV